MDVLQDAKASDKAKEEAIARLVAEYKSKQNAVGLADLVKKSRVFLASLPKAKTAKLVKQLIDDFSDIPDSQSLQIDVCKECILWAEQDKRVFLKQALETRLAGLFLQNKLYSEALPLIAALNKQLKKLDDKTTLTEVQLLESKAYHSLRNLAKSRAALTSARTSANAIYCPPLTQAGLDMQSGIIHADEKDYKTAYSYFYETMEGYSGQSDEKRAILALKYMLLCKVMLNLAEDVHSIVNGKIASKHVGPDIEAMKAVAKAYKNRSLSEFEAALAKYKNELTDDNIVRSHLTALYDTLLEQNLLRIIGPFSRVEIAHVASLVKLPTSQVEQKLSQMILDKVFDGVLDQGAGCLIVYEEVKSDKTYEAAQETIKGMEKVVESLYQKAEKV